MISLNGKRIRWSSVRIIDSQKAIHHESALVRLQSCKCEGGQSHGLARRETLTTRFRLLPTSNLLLAYPFLLNKKQFLKSRIHRWI